MSDINWWLIALAFLLGLALTLALTVRRVKREVPVYGSPGRGPGIGDADASTTANLAGGAAAGAAAATAKIPSVADEPYGVGSIRVAATADGPDGYTVKGNEDSMLYHTPDSPSYKQTIAELWFRDAESAEGAGFTRWDKASGAAATAAAATAVGGATAKFASTAAEPEAEPYGPGSARVAAGATAPTGWTVKGNEDSMLYHTPDSPSYKQTIAELWFRDEEAAVRAGFARWDSGKTQRGLK